MSHLDYFPRQDFIFREAAPTDASTIQELFKLIHQEYNFEVDFLGRDQDLVHIRQYYSVNKNFSGVLIDSKSNTLMGSVGLKNKGNDVAELCRLYLLGSYRGLGLGKRLLLNAITIAKKLSYKKLVLETHSSMVEAIALYEKLGFKEIPPFSSKDTRYCDYASELCLESLDLELI